MNIVKKCARFAAALAIATAALGQARAAEYFVSKQGDDAGDGLTRATAFATVQKGVDALRPGDTLTIGPGEYREAVSRDGLGSMETATVIRAEIPGTAVLRGDVPAPTFRKVRNYRFVYAADFDHDGTVQVINELDTLTVFQAMPNVGELDFAPATCHYDAESRRLYISTSDGAPPETHRYTVSTLGSHGLFLVNPRRVVVEGLSATGFNTAGSAEAGYGILLRNGRECVIRDSRAWMNGWGIEVDSRDEGTGANVIDRCVAWANDSPFGNDRRGGISGFRHRGDVIRRSEAFFNANCGIYLRIDADPEIASRLEDNHSWGNRWNFIIKSNPGGVNISERNIEGIAPTGPDSGRINPIHGLLLRGGTGDKEAPGTIVADREANLDLPREFADPDNRDYRLQATSRFRGTGPDGSDRGPFQYKANIFYVRPDGDDSADGLSVENAWATLPRGLRNLRPGDTLYLETGVYRGNIEASLQGEEGNAISIRGRGVDPAVISGAVQLADSRHVEFKRIRFEGETRVSDGAGIAFDNCEFAQASVLLAASGVDGIGITHCAFADFERAAVALRNSRGAHLSGNLYDNILGVGVLADTADTIRYSDYNAYRRTDPAWEAGGETLALEDAQGHDRYSDSLPSEFAPAKGAVSLHDRPPVATGGPAGHPFGPYRADPRREALRLTAEPAVHSVSATTANIEWMTLLPSQVHLAWGPTPELENTDIVEAEYFGSYSLTGLEPGRTYYFQIKELKESGRNLGQHEPTRLGVIEAVAAKPDSGMISFATAREDREPVVYYVSPAGDDDNTGLDRANAWRTIQRAANRANAGDTVLIGGGEYEEQVRVRATGAPGKPIAFRSMPGEKVVFVGAQLDDAFAVWAKRHLRFDGMYLLSMRFNLYKSGDIEITRCFAGKHGSPYPPAGGLLHAEDCSGLLMKNCVSLSAKSGPRFWHCSDVRVENSVFFRNMIYQILFYPHRPEDSVHLNNNIFTDGLLKKFTVPMIGILIPSTEAFHVRDNCYFPRKDPDEKGIVRFRWADALTFAQMEEEIGPTGSLLADPKFAGAAGVPERTEAGDPIYPVDRLVRLGFISMDKFFATNPELVERGIGLQREAFDDFHFNKEQP